MSMVEKDGYQQAKLQTTKLNRVQDAVDRPAKQVIADVSTCIAVLATRSSGTHQSQRLILRLGILLSRAIIAARDRSCMFSVP